MWITFIEEASLDGEGGQTHYCPGYQCDVSEKFAQKWVASGHAVYGLIELEPEDDEPDDDLDDDLETEEEIEAFEDKGKFPWTKA